MPKHYSYDPTKCMDGGLDQMRFELQDTVVEQGEAASPLCDEEYNAILAKHGHNWKMAYFVCLKAIMMKLSLEVSGSVDGLSYSMDERAKRWKAMYDEAKKDLASINSVPRAGYPGSLMPHGGTPYFYNDLHANPRRFR